MALGALKAGATGHLPEGTGDLAKGPATIDAFSRHRAVWTVSGTVSGNSRASARRHPLTLTELGHLDCDGEYFRSQPTAPAAAPD
jgi:hypothetical protein